MSAETEYDVIVVGGGLVGASLACALGSQALRVAMIEAAPLAVDSPPHFDARTVALSHGSRTVLAALGVWDAVLAGGATPIRRIHVSDRGHFGSARIDCREEGVEALGYVVELRVLGQVLARALRGRPNVDLVTPAQLVGLEVDATQARARVVQAGTERCLTGRLIVAADGGDSQVRRLTGMRAWQLGYGQTAIIANVTSERPHDHVAYERFTDTGPMALLPMGDDAAGGARWALVWTVPEAQRDAMLALPDAEFLERLQQRFGGRLGRFRAAGTRHAYPLSLMQVRDSVGPRLVVIGNAAHTLHPVAGQGFNLGLRDVAWLAQLLSDAAAAGRDVGARELLRSYERLRRRDRVQVAAFTDLLVRVFSTRFPPVAAARNLGLLALDLMPSLKHTLARHSMGFVGRLPRLARGLPL